MYTIYTVLANPTHMPYHVWFNRSAFCTPANSFKPYLLTHSNHTPIVSCTITSMLPTDKNGCLPLMSALLSGNKGWLSLKMLCIWTSSTAPSLQLASFSSYLCRRCKKTRTNLSLAISYINTHTLSLSLCLSLSHTHTHTCAHFVKSSPRQVPCLGSLTRQERPSLASI